MLALFPLQTVVYPHEQISLHIFEKRYQQLIADCEGEGILFGIPTVIDNKLEYGTEVKLEKVANRSTDGTCDIVCLGMRIFKIKRFYKYYTDKLYAGGDVEFLGNNYSENQTLQQELLQNISNLYTELMIKNALKVTIPFLSYQVAHKIGLALSQEYHLLKLRDELQRLEYLITHLKKTIPVVREMNRTKEIIRMNGHFKSFDPLNFDDFEL